MKTLLQLLLVLLITVPATTFADDGGRTDGPEGSEIGQGGYSEELQFSAALTWGAAFASDEVADPGPPLFFGATLSYWTDDWFILEATAAQLLDSETTNILVGPRFRSGYYPVALSAGLKAGAIVDADDGVLFGVSPELGGDIIMNDRVVLGLGYALDLPIGGGRRENRLFLNLGYRF